VADGFATITGRQPQAIRTALAVLRAVARAGPGVTAQQISATLAVPPSTLYRVIRLLIAEEYLVRLPGRRGLALGPRVSELAGEVDAHPRRGPGREADPPPDGELPARHGPAAWRGVTGGPAPSGRKLRRRGDRLGWGNAVLAGAAPVRPWWSSSAGRGDAGGRA
jgi:hypothetical protein